MARLIRPFWKDQDVRWTPLLYLSFVTFFLLQPALNHAGWREWTIDLAGLGVFLACYFPLFTPHTRRVATICLSGITALGLLYSPWNPGASTFFIYAAAMVGFAFESQIAYKLLAGILGVAGIEAWLLHFDRSFWISMLLYAAVIGLANIHFGARARVNDRLRMAQAEVERLAKVAERERIARDMHDVLGHTLSVIVLKSELASRLIDRDPARARLEMADVEQTAREALAEVRKAIRGYRAESLEEEFTRARATLKTAGVEVECATERVPLSPAQETVLALVIREAVTNVVRHAHARFCRLRLASSGRDCRLEIEDDGRGGGNAEGNGLRGMRERIEALEGTLVRDTRSGTHLTITLPLA